MTYIQWPQEPKIIDFEGQNWDVAKVEFHFEGKNISLRKENSEIEIKTDLISKKYFILFFLERKNNEDDYVYRVLRSKTTLSFEANTIYNIILSSNSKTITANFEKVSKRKKSIAASSNSSTKSNRLPSSSSPSSISNPAVNSSAGPQEIAIQWNTPFSHLDYKFVKILSRLLDLLKVNQLYSFRTLYKLLSHLTKDYDLGLKKLYPEYIKFINDLSDENTESSACPTEISVNELPDENTESSACPTEKSVNELPDENTESSACPTEISVNELPDENTDSSACPIKESVKDKSRSKFSQYFHGKRKGLKPDFNKKSILRSLTPIFKILAKYGITKILVDYKSLFLTKHPFLKLPSNGLYCYGTAINFLTNSDYIKNEWAQYFIEVLEDLPIQHQNREFLVTLSPIIYLASTFGFEDALLLINHYTGDNIKTKNYFQLALRIVNEKAEQAQPGEDYENDKEKLGKYLIDSYNSLDVRLKILSFDQINCLTEIFASFAKSDKEILLAAFRQLMNNTDQWPTPSGSCSYSGYLETLNVRYPDLSNK